MTIPLTGNGSLFSRLGLIWGGSADNFALEGGTATARVLSTANWQTRVGNLETQYADSPNDLLLLSGDNGFGQNATPINQIINSWYNSQTSFFSTLQTLCNNTMIKMADQDAGGLQQRTLQSALTYLINQMNTVIAAPTSTGTITPTTGTGSVAAGTYQFAVTYVGSFGETTPSPIAPSTLSLTGEFTVNGPGAETGATGWYLYMSQANGSVLTRQQAAGSPSTIGTPLVVSTPPTTTGLGPPNANTAIASTVNASTVSVGAQTNFGNPNGNPIIVISALNGKGQTQQYSYNETITCTVTADAQTGNATLGQELLSVVGQSAAASFFAYNWPAGSGSSLSLNAVSSLTNNSNGNVLQNSSWTTFTTANVPDNWTVVTGTAGTQVVAGGSANAYVGTNSLGFVGDSATLTAITQLFNQTPSTIVGAGGTSYKILPTTPYCVNFWFKLSAASPSAGVLEVALIDGSGNILNDYSDNQNLVTANLHTTADTNWHNVNAVFRLPVVLPAQVKLRIRLSTALTTGTTVYISGLSLNPMTQFYSGGPFVSIFSGNTQMILNDAWTLAYTVTWGLVQQYAQRFFGVGTLGYRLPAATSSPTVPDSVVT